MRLPDHKEIVPECEGCKRVFREAIGDKRLICSCRPYPKMAWLGGVLCEDATHIGREEPEEEGRYDSRKKSR
jgi:hypothetical protein